MTVAEALANLLKGGPEFSQSFTRFMNPLNRDLPRKIPGASNNINRFVFFNVLEILRELLAALKWKQASMKLSERV